MPGARHWLQENAGLSELTSRALLEEETRPRVFSSSDGLIAILRGINFNAGADPDDMVVLRLCVDEERLITVRYRPLMTPRDMLSELVEKRKGARSVPELFVKLTERLTERMNAVVVELDEKLDSIEEELEEGEFPSLRRQLTDVRQAAVRLRRYIGPQRGADTDRAARLARQEP
jgi:zinc transporter